MGLRLGIACLLAWWAAIAAARAEGPGLAPPADRARVELEARGQAAEADRLYRAGDYAAAIPLYEAERASRAALGDRRFEAHAARAIGCCRRELGELDAAIDAWNEARVLDARRDDRGFEGYDWCLIGQAELLRDRPEAARRALEESLPLLSTAVDRDHEADARLLLARALSALGRTSEAWPHLDRARALARGLGDGSRVAAADLGAADAARALGEPGPAAEWLLDARTAFVDAARPAEAAAVDRLLADAMIDLGRPDVAEARARLAAEAHGALGDRGRLAGDLEFLAALAADRDEPVPAVDLARRALAERRAAGDDPRAESEARVALARYQGQAGHWSAALATLAEALGPVRRDGAPDEQVRLLILAAEVAARARETARAARWLDEAEQVAERADVGALRRLVVEARRRVP